MSKGDHIVPVRSPSARPSWLRRRRIQQGRGGEDTHRNRHGQQRARDRRSGGRARCARAVLHRGDGRDQLGGSKRVDIHGDEWVRVCAIPEALQNRALDLDLSEWLGEDWFDVGVEMLLLDIAPCLASELRIVVSWGGHEASICGQGVSHPLAPRYGAAVCQGCPGAQDRLPDAPRRAGARGWPVHWGDPSLEPHP
jgi:hypothetical protein